MIFTDSFLPAARTEKGPPKKTQQWFRIRVAIFADLMNAWRAKFESPGTGNLGQEAHFQQWSPNLRESPLGSLASYLFVIVCSAFMRNSAA